MSASPALTPSQIADLLNFVLPFKKLRVNPYIVKSWRLDAQHRVELWCQEELVRYDIVRRTGRLYVGVPLEVQRLMQNRRAA